MRDIETGLHYPLQLDELPESWDVGYVGDFADTIQPGFASGKHNQEGTGIPHLRPMNVDRLGNIDFEVVKYVSPDSDSKRLQVNDVLFNNTNSPALIGKTSVITRPGDWGFSNHMTRVVFNKAVSAKFAAYQLHFLWMTGYYLHKCVKHVNQASISSKELACTVPFVVSPLYEQTRIVAEIEKQFSRLDEAVANLKRVKANLKRYKAAVLKAAVEGKLTAEWRKQHPDAEPADKLLERILAERRKAAGKGKYKEPVAPDTSELPELPAGWVWAKFDQVTERVTKGSSPNWQGFEYCEEGIPFVRSQNVGWGTTDFTDVAFLPAGFNQIEKKSVLCEGDVLLNIVGASIGRAAIAPKPVAGGNVNQAVAVIRLHANGASNQFALLYLLSSHAQRRIHSGKVDVARANFSLEDIRAMPLPLPPLAEQHQIVAEVERRLSIVAGADAQVDANLRRAERLRQSILKQAFSGQLAPQDTNDEPASVLLERIRGTQPVQTRKPAARQRKHSPPVPKTAAPTSEPLPMVAEAPATYGDAIIARILAAMQPGREYARADLADPLGLTTGQWNVAIQELKRRSKVRQAGEKRGARYILLKERL